MFRSDKKLKRKKQYKDWKKKNNILWQWQKSDKKKRMPVNFPKRKKNIAKPKSKANND